jgi:hypothetical protein
MIPPQRQRGSETYCCDPAQKGVPRLACHGSLISRAINSGYGFSNKRLSWRAPYLVAMCLLTGAAWNRQERTESQKMEFHLYWTKYA